MYIFMILYLESWPPSDWLSKRSVKGTEINESISCQKEVRDKRRDRVQFT